MEEQKKGRGRKRKAANKPQYNDVSSDFIYYYPLPHKYFGCLLDYADVLFVIYYCLLQYDV